MDIFIIVPKGTFQKVILAAIGMFTLGCKGILRSIVQKNHNA